MDQQANVTVGTQSNRLRVCSTCGSCTAVSAEEYWLWENHSASNDSYPACSNCLHMQRICKLLIQQDIMQDIIAGLQEQVATALSSAAAYADNFKNIWAAIGELKVGRTSLMPASPTPHCEDQVQDQSADDDQGNTAGAVGPDINRGIPAPSPTHVSVSTSPSNAAISSQRIEPMAAGLLLSPGDAGQKFSSNKLVEPTSRVPSGDTCHHLLSATNDTSPRVQNCPVFLGSNHRNASCSLNLHLHSSQQDRYVSRYNTTDVGCQTSTPDDVGNKPPCDKACQHSFPVMLDAECMTQPSSLGSFSTHKDSPVTSHNLPAPVLHSTPISDIESNSLPVTQLTPVTNLPSQAQNVCQNREPSPAIANFSSSTYILLDEVPQNTTGQSDRRYDQKSQQTPRDGVDMSQTRPKRRRRKRRPMARRNPKVSKQNHQATPEQAKQTYPKSLDTGPATAPSLSTRVTQETGKMMNATYTKKLPLTESRGLDNLKKGFIGDNRSASTAITTCPRRSSSNQLRCSRTLGHRLFVTDLHPSTSVECLQAFIWNSFGLNPIITKIPARQNSYSSFIVHVVDGDWDKLGNPSLWPAGASIKFFVDRRRKLRPDYINRQDHVHTSSS